LWDFQKKLIPMGESVAASLGADPTGIMRILAWMIRATFLDPRIARQAALDSKGNWNAVTAIALTAVPAILFSGLSTMSFGSGLIKALIVTTGLTVVSTAATVYILSALSVSMVGVKLDPGVLLRAMAYATGANMLGFLPGLGQVVRLWSIPATVVAVRELTAAETQKVAIFMIVGAVITVAAEMVLGPILYGLFSFL
jgi:hypothetical protein